MICLGLQNRIEQVVRLIRSKGVGVFFRDAEPTDVPGYGAGAVGNRAACVAGVSPKDQKGEGGGADLSGHPKVNVEAVIRRWGVGRRWFHFLDEKGIPGMGERAMILPPHSQIGPITRSSGGRL